MRGRVGCSTGWGIRTARRGGEGIKEGILAVGRGGKQEGEERRRKRRRAGSLGAACDLGGGQCFNFFFLNHYSNLVSNSKYFLLLDALRKSVNPRNMPDYD